MDDLVTGARTAVEVDADLPIERIWALITDVTRIGEWSPECVWAQWRDELRRQFPDGARIGDRFDARNVYAGGYESKVECVVTEADHPYRFAWAVLDDDGDIDRPGSTWRYDLAPTGSGTRITHTFIHGPGATGLREGVEHAPDRAAEVVARRLATLRRNMIDTLTAMTKGAVR